MRLYYTFFNLIQELIGFIDHHVFIRYGDIPILIYPDQLSDGPRLGRAHDRASTPIRRQTALERS